VTSATRITTSYIARRRCEQAAALKSLNVGFTMFGKNERANNRETAQDSINDVSMDFLNYKVDPQTKMPAEGSSLRRASAFLRLRRA
jgi:hypothetical protein